MVGLLPSDGRPRNMPWHFVVISALTNPHPPMVVDTAAGSFRLLLGRPALNDLSSSSGHGRWSFIASGAGAVSQVSQSSW